MHYSNQLYTNEYGSLSQKSLSKYNIFNLILRNSKTNMQRKAQNQIRKRIEAAGDPQLVDQLCLDSIEIKALTPNIKKLLQGCPLLEYLTMNNCSLKNLDNFPHLPNLIVLELSDNNLSGEDLKQLSQAPLITFLTLDNNNINQSQRLRALVCLPSLQILQAHDNPVSNSYDYRETIFNILPQLKAIDCEDREGNKIQEQNPSDYFSLRQFRSRHDITDFLDDDEEDSKDLKMQLVTASQYLDESVKENETNQSPSGSFYSDQWDFRRARPSIMDIRTRLNYDSEEESDRDLCRQFNMKFIKRQ